MKGKRPKAVLSLIGCRNGHAKDRLDIFHTLLYIKLSICDEAAMEDVLRSLGFLCLGSRMKRIGEQLQADTQRVLARLDMRIQSSQYPLLAALDRLGPLPVGELAQSLGVAQPGVTRSVALLAELGLVEVNPSEEDQRRRIVSLSRNGRRLVDQAKRDIW